MEFGTCYQINCETEREWHDDLARIRDTGFDSVMLSHVLQGQLDLRGIVYQREKTLRALREVERAGLEADLCIWNPEGMGRIPHAYRPKTSTGRTIASVLPASSVTTKVTS